MSRFNDSKRSTANHIGQIIFAALAVLGLAATIYILVFIANDIAREPVVGLSLGGVFLSICMLVISPLTLISTFLFTLLQLNPKKSKEQVRYGRGALGVALISSLVLIPVLYIPDSAYSLFIKCSAVGVALLAAVALTWGIITLRRAR